MFKFFEKKNKRVEKILEIAESGNQVIRKVYELNDNIKNMRFPFVEENAKIAYNMLYNFYLRFNEIDDIMREYKVADTNVINQISNEKYKIHISLEILKDIFEFKNFDGILLNFFEVTTLAIVDNLQSSIMTFNNLYNMINNKYLNM